MKGINLIKLLFLSIHPPYISWFYHNQSNFFLGIIFSIECFFKSKETNGQTRGLSNLEMKHVGEHAIIGALVKTA